MGIYISTMHIHVYMYVYMKGRSQEFQKEVSNDRMNIKQGLVCLNADKSITHACTGLTRMKFLPNKLISLAIYRR